MDDITNTPLTDNEHIKELLSIMRDNNADTTNISAMINHVAAIERYMETAGDQLAAMRRELADMREIQKHPLKTALQNTIEKLQNNLNAAKVKLGEIKADIIEGAKNAVAAIKEKGKTALNGVMKFFHIKGGLESLSANLTHSIREDNKAIARIDTISQQYHETGKAVKNMSRALRGKEAVQEVKPLGKLAKALQAPYKADRSINYKMRDAVYAALRKLEQLDNDVTARKQERADAKAEKPSLLDRLDENKERVSRVKLDIPAPARAKVKEAAR